MVIRRIVSHPGRTSWLLTGLRVTALNTKVVLVSRPRFTDARNPRPSRHWSQNGIKLIKCHPPTCACHQAECPLLHQIERRAPHKVSHLSGTIAFVSRTGGLYAGYIWLRLAHAAGCVEVPTPGFSFVPETPHNTTESRTFGSMPQVFWTLAIPVIQGLKSDPPCISRC